MTALQGYRCRIRVKAKVVVRPGILAKFRIIGVGNAIDRRSTGPATHNSRSQFDIRHSFKAWQGCEPRGLIPHRPPEQTHILPQPSKHKEGTVLSPLRDSGTGNTWNKGVGTRCWMSKHQHSRPDEILARI